MNWPVEDPNTKYATVKLKWLKISIKERPLFLKTLMKDPSFLDIFKYLDNDEKRMEFLQSKRCDHFFLFLV